MLKLHQSTQFSILHRFCFLEISNSPAAGLAGQAAPLPSDLGKRRTEAAVPPTDSKTRVYKGTARTAYAINTQEFDDRVYFFLVCIRRALVKFPPPLYHSRAPFFSAEFPPFSTPLLKSN